MAKQPHLFLDCDGVLADFDAGVRDLLGMDAKRFEAKHGRGEFWKRLARHGNFYGNLEEMLDAQVLFQAVKHLKPTILTGLPLGKWAAPQKERWAAKHFPGVPIITTMARQRVTIASVCPLPHRRMCVMASSTESTTPTARSSELDSAAQSSSVTATTRSSKDATLSSPWMVTPAS